MITDYAYGQIYLLKSYETDLGLLWKQVELFPEASHPEKIDPAAKRRSPATGAIMVIIGN